MKVTLESKLQIISSNSEQSKIVPPIPTSCCYIKFDVIFDKEDWGWSYDWTINKLVYENQVMDFHYLDTKFKVMIECAIEDRLYNFNFDDCYRHLA